MKIKVVGWQDLLVMFNHTSCIYIWDLFVMKITCKATVTSPYWLSNQFLAQPFYLKALIKNSMYIFVQGIATVLYFIASLRGHMIRRDKQKIPLLLFLTIHDFYFLPYM